MFVCFVEMHFFKKQKAHSSKAALEESLFYGVFLISLRNDGGRKVYQFLEKNPPGRESRVPPHPLEMHCACNRERNVLLAGARQKGW